MTLSQNGWTAYATTEHFTRFNAGGIGWWAADKWTAIVFGEFITRFVEEIEALGTNPLQCWSWANRLIRGSTSVVSNHGSATAIDLNSLRHPRGVHGTFSTAEQRRMHVIRDSITDDAGRPVLRLGMDYVVGTIDDMHVEVNVTPGSGRMEQAARRILARRAEDDDMKLTDDVDLTPEAVKLLGAESETVRMLLQWPPAVRAARNEIAELAKDTDARFDALGKQADVVRAEMLAGIAELKALLTPKTGK